MCYAALDKGWITVKDKYLYFEIKQTMQKPTQNSETLSPKHQRLRNWIIEQNLGN